MSGLAGFSAINEIKCFGPYGKSFANMCKVRGFQLNGYIPVRLTGGGGGGNQQAHSSPYARQNESKRKNPFISDGGGCRGRHSLTDVYKQKVTDKNPNTKLHCLPGVTDEPTGTPVKSLPGHHPGIKRCQQAA